MLSHFSHVQLLATLWTVARQALLSMGFPGQEYWSGLPFPSPGDLPSPGTEARSLLSPALTGRFRPLAPPVLWEHAKAEKSEPWGVKGSLELLALEEG